ncbi:methionine aminopeptidase 2-1 [Coleophoma cylindrospora]|uniref:Methionine aminopeptidase 2 n=1 Tax=Coleophoma cylindrospora TaxID=1849047 RepID=A0A3D8RU48_9HELO|nr:methionine aminopeptidase 2-1 [Coleophoma cylindrospora]
MASKTYEGREVHPENTAKPPASKSSGAGTGVLLMGSGDGDGGSDDPDGDGEGLEVVAAGGGVGNGEEKKKKKRKRSKKSAAKTAKVQSSPPRVLVSDLFPSGAYPMGETVGYADENLKRTTGEETRYVERFDETFLSDYREAAEVHRQVRNWAQQNIKPGASLTSIAEGIEDGVRALLGHQGLETGDCLKGGMGFPTGLCVNNVAAHFTPNSGSKEVVLQQQDVLSVDFGVHVNGRIVDSAFTVAFDPVYDNLLAAVKDATNTGIKTAGVDAHICDISAAIQEAMESYEVELNGKVIPVKAVRNITGHNIKQYQIHGGKSIPFIKNSDQTKMEAGEVFAIETFGTTGSGVLRDDVGIYGYGKSYDAPRANLQLSSAKSLLKTINQNFGTLVFARRYLERLGVTRYLAGMNELVSKGIVESYGPLVDTKGSYVAQFEHTLLLHDDKMEIISRGDDY